MKKILILLTLILSVQILAQEGQNKPRESREINREKTIENFLKTAAKNGNKEQVEYLLKQNLNTKTKLDALKIAAKHSHPNIMWLLVNSNTDELKFWALYFAALYGYKNMIIPLLKFNISSNQQKSALETAILSNNEDIVKLFINHGNINEKDKLHALGAAIFKGNENIINLLLSNTNQDFQEKALKLHDPKGYISAELTKLAKKSEEKPEETNKEKLRNKFIEAVKNNNEKQVSSLLDNQFIDHETKMEALLIANKHNYRNIINTLLSSSDQAFQQNASIFAAKNGYINIIKKQLLFSKISKYTKGIILKEAVKYNHEDIVKLLLDYDKISYPINIRDKKEALNLAFKNQHHIIQLLKNNINSQ